MNKIKNKNEKKYLEKDGMNQLNSKGFEGTDPNNDNSDTWFHSNCMEMTKDDNKTTDGLLKFLNSMGYEQPMVEINEENKI